MQAREIEIVGAGKDFPRVEENGEIEMGPCLPAIFGGHEQIARVAKPLLAEAADGPGSTHRLHQIKRYPLAVIGQRLRRPEPKSQVAVSIAEGDVGFDVGNVAGKSIKVVGSIVIAFRVESNAQPRRRNLVIE